MQDNFCVECDKGFRSQSGLNGHNQWKHNRLPLGMTPNTTTSRAVEMFERVQQQLDVLRDGQENLKDMVQSLNTVSLVNEPIGIAEPSGNNNTGNGSVNNNTGNDDEPKYYCGECTRDVEEGDAHCRHCGDDLDWNGIGPS